MTSRQAFGIMRPCCTGENCGHVHFFDPKVAAVTFVRDGDKLLLVKRAMNPERGKWALPAGYVNATENPAEAAIRETQEETGLEIEIIGLLDVLHHPPRPDERFQGASIIIVYAGRVLGGRLQAQDDVDDAAWFSLDNLPEIAFESTRRAIHEWMQSGD